MLRGRVDLRVSRWDCRGDEAPLVASFAAVSASSLLSTSLCPATHWMVILWSDRFAFWMRNAEQTIVLMRRCPGAV